ncbi:MAG: EF-P beta-lysylation protein EpmB [Saccharospirillum sp.]|nr:EF-P beta-lysylation protein EpmB [Saccharospirillum sp.]
MLTEIEPGVDTSDRISLLDTVPDWQKELRNAVRSVDELLRLLELKRGDLPWQPDDHPRFPVRIPASFVRRMQKGDPRDPLLLQVLPAALEKQTLPGYVADPLAEVGQSATPGLIHKYQGRVLILATETCAVHCRYCFRQHFPYGENRLSTDQWQRILDYLHADPSISEVIFSGGDPLSLSNNKLERLLTDLARVPHLTTLRLHSRTAVVLPSRLDQGLVTLLSQKRWRTLLVLHCNHARELNEEVAAALLPMRKAGVTLLNQAVLLSGINDQLNTQVELSQALFDQGVLPYYLHLLDPVAGAARFQTDDRAARELWQAMQAKLPGYLLPRLVRETPGETAKTWMNGSHERST